ncbi:MAG: alpha/beta hydrolase [Thermodesulfobacterium sp.]|nr:alpha/beta hydrolase [Thermodesulfobacterium sp.]
MFYDYSFEKNYRKKLLKENRVFKEYIIEFESPFKKYPDKAVGFLFLPHQLKTKKALIFLHGSGNYHFGFFKNFSSLFSQKGIPTFFIILPFHYLRKKEINNFFSDNLFEVFDSFRQAVVDTRASLDCLEKEGYLGDFSILGISLGGIIATIVSAVDKRIKKAILINTAGGFVYIIWESSLPFLRKNYKRTHHLYGCNKKKCQEIYSFHKEFVKELKDISLLGKIKPKKECFLFDPLSFCHLLKERVKVTLFSSSFDEIIPKKAQESFKKALGYPSKYTLFGDHFLSLILNKKKIINISSQFLLND